MALSAVPNFTTCATCPVKAARIKEKIGSQGLIFEKLKLKAFREAADVEICGFAFY